MAFKWRGKFYSNPGAYTQIEIVGDASAVEVPFKVPCLIVSSNKGIPYNATDGQDPVKKFIDPLSIAQYYGYYRDSHNNDADVMARYYFKQGAGAVYCINLRPITNPQNVSLASGKKVFDMKTYGPEYNVWGLGIDDTSGLSEITIRPVKNVKFLTATATSTDASITVDDTSGLVAGQTGYIYMADGSANEKTAELTISSLSENTITFSGAIGGTGPFAVSADSYCFFYQPDPDNDIVIENVPSDWDSVSAALEASGYFTEVSGSADPGEALSGDVTFADIESFISSDGDKAISADIDDAVDTPALIQKLYDWCTGVKLLRFFTWTMADCADEDEATDRRILIKDFANYMDNNREHNTFNYFGNLAVNTDLTQTVPDSGASALVHPANVAYVLASPWCYYCAVKSDSTSEIGVDGYPGYVSFAPAVMGMEMANPINYNLTFKKLEGVKTVGAFERHSESPELNDWGVIHPSLFQTPVMIGPHLQIGTNTFRAALAGTLEEEWDAVSKAIYLPKSMHIVASFRTDLKATLDNVVRADGGEDEIRSSCVRLINSYIRDRLLVPGQDGSPAAKINYVTRVNQSSWEVNVLIHPVGSTNYIGALISVNNTP